VNPAPEFGRQFVGGLELHLAAAADVLAVSLALACIAAAGTAADALDLSDSHLQIISFAPTPRGLRLQR
jgi:hypothetical protein